MQEATRVARKLSALAELGFERIDAVPVASESVRVGRRTYKVTSCVPGMGTLVSVSALASSSDKAAESISRAFEEMRRLIMIFSRFEGASVLSYLNSEGSIDSPPPEFSQLITHSLRYFEISRGAFDVSVEPLVNLFRKSLDGALPRKPTDTQVAEALRLVNSGNIELSDRRVAFVQDGMRITLDGIAKGYIVDAMARVLRRHKVKNYLINAGGDIRTAGNKGNRQPWTVAVQDPSKAGVFPDMVHMGDGAVATSGSYEIYFDREREFHHIVNSSTGKSPALNSSVSVRAPLAVAADALATAVFVMKPEEGVAFVDRLRRCACLIIDASGRRLKSKRWKSVSDSLREKAVQ
jgi:thiamine biosynthesis lipoprotein